MSVLASPTSPLTISRSKIERPVLSACAVRTSRLDSIVCCRGG